MVTTRVVSIERFMKGFEAQPFSIGIDVHKRNSVEVLFALPLNPHARLTMESHLRELMFYQNKLREVEGQCDRGSGNIAMS